MGKKKGWKRWATKRKAGLVGLSVLLTSIFGGDVSDFVTKVVTMHERVTDLEETVSGLQRQIDDLRRR